MTPSNNVFSRGSIGLGFAIARAGFGKEHVIKMITGGSTFTLRVSTGPSLRTVCHMPSSSIQRAIAGLITSGRSEALRLTIYVLPLPASTRPIMSLSLALNSLLEGKLGSKGLSKPASSRVPSSIHK